MKKSQWTFVTTISLDNLDNWLFRSVTWNHFVTFEHGYYCCMSNLSSSYKGKKTSSSSSCLWILIIIHSKVKGERLGANNYILTKVLNSLTQMGVLLSITQEYTNKKFKHIVMWNTVTYHIYGTKAKQGDFLLWLLDACMFLWTIVTFCCALEGSK